MKCPKCGFVSYPGIAQCKKCGHAFPSEKEKPSQILTLFSGKSASAAATPGPPSLEASPPGPSALEMIPIEDAPINAPVALSAGLTIPESRTPPAGEGPAWRNEISQRVETFRRRRARIHGSSDSNLEFDFQESGEPEAIPTVEILPEETARARPDIDAEWGETPHFRSESAPAHLDALEIEPALSPEGVLDASGLESEDPEGDSRLSRRPVEFVLDPAPHRPDSAPGPGPDAAPLAPMSRRFLGGIIDATVLVVSAGVFALIFWRAGGQMSAHPLNLVVVGLITVFLVLAYFGAFTALTSTTPGLLWMGIEVRSLHGGAPTLRQAFWRAFGYLVSSSALLLGFVWALVDSEGLTWHDRMSDTFLTTSDGGVENRELRVDG